MKKISIADCAFLPYAKTATLAQDNKDEIGVVLATSKSAYIMVLSGKAEAAIAQLTTIEPAAQRSANALGLR